ncbi:MAG TPA: hypothetical protein PLV92_07305 [Pirellulaceae bacterium]|nr:hypothetical protein [Pirellulaceae bacterium]
MFGDLWRSLRRGRSERTETHEEEARRRKRKLLRQSLDVETLETREVPAVMLFAVGNVHDLTLVHNGGNYQIVQTSNPLNLLASQAAASVSEVKITGVANVADELTVNHGPGIVDVPVTFDGGAGGGDELTLTGFSFTTVTHQMTGPGAATVDQDGRVVTTIGIERTVDALPAAARSFQLPATNDLVTLDTGAASGDGVSRLSSPNTVPTIDFAAPQQMLTVDGGLGADWFELKAVDFAGAAPQLRLNGGDGDDTFQVAAGSSLPNTLTLDGGAGLNNAHVEKTHIDDTKGDGLVGTQLHSLLVTGGSMSGNRGHGIVLDMVSAFAAIDVTCDGNLGGGLLAQHGDTATVVGGSYSANWGAGLDLMDISRSVELQGVTASGNIKGGVGLRATNVGSLSDSSGSYLQNADGGIVVTDVAGDVMLTGTTADDNDADFSGVGDGFAAMSSGGKHEWPSEGGVGGNAIGGRLTITGGSFSRTCSPETHRSAGFTSRASRAAPTCSRAGNNR